MRRNSTVPALAGALLVSFLALVLAGTVLEVPVRAGDAPPVLDGEPRSFLVVGYSTSYAWPQMLQEMLDRHTGGERVYHVLNAVVGGSPVEYWNALPGTERYERVFGAMVRDFLGDEPRLRGGAPAPTVALCQQSLQFTRTRRGPIARVDDHEGLRIGTDALEKLAFRLRDVGLERVYYGMHIYKEPVEPEVGNERFALAALLERGHPFVFEGPDVWSLTIQEHPEAFEEDGVHPNERGMKLMAEAWYRTLSGKDAKEEVITALHETTYDIDTMMRAYLAWRRGDVQPPPSD